MKSANYPARFVGEFDDQDYCYRKVINVGDVALYRGFSRSDGQPIAYLFVRCACGNTNDLTLEGPAPGPRWELLSRNPVTIGGSVRTWHRHNPGENDFVCHYVVTNGKLCMLADSVPSPIDAAIEERSE